MRFEIRDLKDGQYVFGCAYSTNNTEKSMSLKRKPILGKIIKNGIFREEGFYELRSNGEIKKSSKVSLFARKYSDNIEESTKIYNQEVQKQIDLLNKLIEKCKADFIK